ncbi:unnamed protein product [Penicillium olsonii]|nr:unnamed protein product [Penicillium olsonii]CAG7932170.1 unnamed protein product [Penicillium olsonii]
MGSTSAVPDYGRRLLPVVVDEAARDEPERVLFYTPRDNQPSQGYQFVTARTFANSVNRVCWWFESQVAIQNEIKTIGYMGPNDLRYFLMMIAAAKTGYRLLLSSPRNSVEGHVSLIEQSGCGFWVTTTGIGSLDFIQDLGIPCIEAPELSQLLEENAVDNYPYTNSWDEGRADILALLHTSGSTGLPKLVPLYLATAATVDGFNLMEPVNGRVPTGVEWKGTRMLCAMPLFHVAGICLGLYSAFFFRWSVILPSKGPIMQHVIEEALDNIELDSAFISPSVLQDIAKSPRVLDKLSKLKFITSAGGPIAQSVGEVIHPRVPIWQTMGMTEGQWMASVVTHPDEWAYFYFHPRTGFEMRPYSEDLCELLYVKKEELALTQPVFVTFPDLDVWESKDLYSRHPTIPDLWRYEMRRDDLIVLSNGEKFNPLAAEGKLASHPWISAAYITGRGRFQAAALLYPDDSNLKKTDIQIIEALWPTMSEVNETLPAFAQLHRDFVKVVRTPFPRTPKGTLARNQTEKNFSKEITGIYESSLALKTHFHVKGSSQVAVNSGIREAIQTVSGIKELTDDDDIFVRGFDSLHVVRLARLLESAFDRHVEIEAGTVYANPSIAKLGSELWSRFRGQSHKEALNMKSTSQMLAKYSASFGSGRAKKEYVIITGTTGSIGPYLLHNLCNNREVAQVWCLNRSADAPKRQVKLARAKGFLPLNWDGKVKFVQHDPTSETLGLNAVDAQDMKEKATIIIHNAWEVNFNLPLSSFEPQFIGLKGLVDICRDARHKIRFNFISSISAAMNWPCELLGSVPEAKIPKFDAAINGYGASKLVAEHLLGRAARLGNLDLSVLRVGQVAGPVQTFGEGALWARRDWVPAIIDASAYLKLLPSDLGSATNLDWIPVDILANIVGQLVESGSSTSLSETYYNLVNPKTSYWTDVLSTIKARLEISLSAEVRIVSLQEWIDSLRNSEALIIQEAEVGHSKSASRAKTGLKLLSFFQMLVGLEQGGDSSDETSVMTNSSDGSSAGEPTWDVANGLSRSSIFADLEPVSTTWFDTWLNQWGY